MTFFKEKRILAVLCTTIVAAVFPLFVWAQTVNIDAMKLLKHVEVSPSPRTGSFEVGSTFDVPIILNSKGVSVNGIEVRVFFDKDKLSIVQQSNGTSIIGIWVEPPRFDNTRGTASYVGVVPNGITTESGFVGTITFKAIAEGQATVKISESSRILLNDGQGTNTIVDSSRAVYAILPKAPEGVRIFSETHPFQDSWYNNNSPVISWDRDVGVDGFSYVLDHKPNTVPENIISTKDTTKSYENLADGLWYFHAKARKGGVWGGVGHFLVRIDTTPPADFKPETNYLVAEAVMADRALVSFVTTDNLSGIDHYEVGVIDKTQPVTESPVFVQTESPFQVSLSKDGKLRVVVRAFDKAGNVRDAFADIVPPNLFARFFQDNLIYILLLIIFAGFFGLIFHYLFGHHILRHLRRAFQVVRREEISEEMQKTLSTETQKENFMEIRREDVPGAPN